jgi:hypothetical protein
MSENRLVKSVILFISRSLGTRIERVFKNPSKSAFLLLSKLFSDYHHRNRIAPFAVASTS